MMKDYLKMGVLNIKHKGLRSWLTMIGIFVGIAAVVSLISVGQGLQTAIESEFNSLGTDVLFIQPLGAGFITSGNDNPSQITTRDEDEISRTKGVIETVSLVFRSERIEYKNDEISFQFVTGVDLEDSNKVALTKRMMDFEIADGRDLKKGDKFKVVAGYSYTQKDDVFSEVIKPGSKVLIKDQIFDVVGTLKKIGSSPDDRSFLMNIDVAEDLLEVGERDGGDLRDYIIAQVSPGMDVEIVADSIERRLMNFRGLDEGEEDFQIQTGADLVGTFNTILDIVQAVLVGIAAISLLVGGIGITNTMYTAVLERTREIGIMKAIGAKNSDVATIFLIESGLLGVVGGLIGVLIGYGISSGVTVLMVQALPSLENITTYFPFWLIAGALGFSFVVGAASGVMPAIQASKMNPVEALRYE